MFLYPKPNSVDLVSYFSLLLMAQGFFALRSIVMGQQGVQIKIINSIINKTDLTCNSEWWWHSDVSKLPIDFIRRIIIRSGIIKYNATSVEKSADQEFLDTGLVFRLIHFWPRFMNLINKVCHFMVSIDSTRRTEDGLYRSLR